MDKIKVILNGKELEITPGFTFRHLLVNFSSIEGKDYLKPVEKEELFIVDKQGNLYDIDGSPGDGGEYYLREFIYREGERNE